MHLYYDDEPFTWDGVHAYAFAKYCDYLHCGRICRFDDDRLVFIDTGHIYLLDDDEDLHAWAVNYEQIDPNSECADYFKEAFRNAVRNIDRTIRPIDSQAFEDELQKYDSGKDGLKTLIYEWFEHKNEYIEEYDPNEETALLENSGKEDLEFSRIQIGW